MVSSSAQCQCHGFQMTATVRATPSGKEGQAGRDFRGATSRLHLRKRRADGPFHISERFHIIRDVLAEPQTNIQQDALAVEQVKHPEAAGRIGRFGGLERLLRLR